MPPQILLTSFQTWLPHQNSNSSDDLLINIQQQKIFEANLLFLRQLPVDIEQAASLVIDNIQAQKIQAIICCGMAESRSKLTIEFHATYQEKKLQTSVDLDYLINHLSHTSISYDAGKFVCEGLYYRVLEYCQQIKLSIPCIFVHVPILTNHNLDIVKQDFNKIINFINNTS